MDQHRLQIIRTISANLLVCSGKLSPNAALWRPQNTYQQHLVANQMANVVPMQTQMIIAGPANVEINCQPKTLWFSHSYAST